MKKFFTLAPLFALAMIAHAQRGSFGAKAGANFYTSKGDVDFDKFSSGKTGFQAGLFYRVPVASRLFIQPEALYSREGANVEADLENTASLTYNHLNVPLMLQLDLPDGVFAETGPQVGFLLNANGKYTENGIASEDDEINKNMNKASFSWGVGLGCMFGNVGLGTPLQLRSEPPVKRRR